MIDRGQLDRWMASAADGDRASIDPLFHALWPIVVDYATRLVGNRSLAEDCAQDALVKVFAQIDRYDRSRDALAWTLAITTWQCRTARKQLARRAEVDLPAGARGSGDGVSGDGASSDGPVAWVHGPSVADPIGAWVHGPSVAEERELVRRALETLATLAPHDVEVIVASITDDDAVRCSLTPATFRKRLERALSRLRLSWRSRHGAL